MKTLIASLFALSLLGGASLAGATPANAAGVGIHIGGAGANIHVGDGHHDRYRYPDRYRYHDRYRHYRSRHCTRWGYRHHTRYCRGWGW